MTNEEILENNKLVAEFMGLYEKHPTGSFYVNGGWWSEYNFRYHNSWDWLMPVVGICLTYLEMHENDFDRLTDALLSVDIKATYETVVKFIKWYNEVNNV